MPKIQKHIDPIKASSMADIRALVKSIDFLVDGWIPRSMLTGIVAEPGVGKSAFCLWLARSVLTGARWFNGSPGPKPGKVLWCSTENDMAITLQRMTDWGIPLENMLAPFSDDPLRSLDLLDESHVDRISRLIRKYDLPLVVIDSLRGGHIADENDSRVGRVLQNMAAIVEETNCSLVIVHHTKKLTVDEELTANSSRGSNAILAMFRAQIGIDRPDQSIRKCRLRVLKENLGIAPDPVGFEVTKTGLEFGPPPAKPVKEKRETGRESAVSWLYARMKPDIWYIATELENEADALGFSKTGTLKRAREDLGITLDDGNIRKQGKLWQWRRCEPK
jgi:archaellum biogenesis ATPase FlaH